MKDTLDLFFELSSEDRLNILTSLQEKPSKLTELSTAVKLPNQEVSRQLARLTELDLCYRDGKSLYNLTPFAEHALDLVPGFSFLSKHRSYFSTHSAMGIPREFRLRIGELSSCALIEDIVTNQYDAQRVVKEANEFIWSLVEQVNVTLGEFTEGAIIRGADHRVIIPSGLVPSEPYKSYIRSWGVGHPMRSKNAKRRFMDKIPIGLIMSEKEVSSIFFPTLEGKLDYQGFKAKGEEARKWCKDIFNHYWNEATDKVPPRLAEFLF